jgi:hypothetical protein
MEGGVRQGDLPTIAALFPSSVDEPAWPDTRPVRSAAAI